MKRIGITGPTGAGKTTALQALAELDAHIIDADAVYHALLESSATLRAELTARFGPSILDGEGRVNRKALGGVVFGDPAALAELNAITHRFILAEIDRQAAGAEEQVLLQGVVDCCFEGGAPWPSTPSPSLRAAWGRPVAR